MDIRALEAPITATAASANSFTGLSKRRSTVRPSSRSFLQTSWATRVRARGRSDYAGTANPRPTVFYLRSVAHVIKCQFVHRAFQTPIDCQAIFTILPANLVGYARECTRPIRLRRDCIAALERCFLAQCRPGDPR